MYAASWSGSIRCVGRVSGKVVVVTGAAGGQGLAEAAALAAEGATVVATDLHDEADTPDGVTYRKLDVAQPDDWRALGAWLESEHGRLDGLVNNAGIPFRARSTRSSSPTGTACSRSTSPARCSASRRRCR